MKKTKPFFKDIQPKYILQYFKHIITNYAWPKHTSLKPEEGYDCAPVEFLYHRVKLHVTIAERTGLEFIMEHIYLWLGYS